MVGVPPAISEMRNITPTARATMISGMTNRRTISLTDGGSTRGSADGAAAAPAAPAGPAPCFNTSDGIGSSVIAVGGGLLWPAAPQSIAAGAPPPDQLDSTVASTCEKSPLAS